MAAKQNAAKAATRGFLELLGPKYDSMALGLAPKELTKKAVQQRLLDEFDYKCVYCGASLNLKTISIDHVVPMNKNSMGLHMLGNLAAACSTCNGQKLGNSLEVFLASHKPAERSRIMALLETRRKKLGATVDVAKLQLVAEALYQDVSKYVERRLAKALAEVPEVSKVAKATLAEVQRKSEYDFTEIAKAFPVGSLVKAKLDGQTGTVVDYSLEGEKGKRSPYIVFFSDQKNKKVTRSPNQVVLVKP